MKFVFISLLFMSLIIYGISLLLMSQVALPALIVYAGQKKKESTSCTILAMGKYRVRFHCSCLSIPLCICQNLNDHQKFIVILLCGSMAKVGRRRSLAWSMIFVRSCNRSKQGYHLSRHMYVRLSTKLWTT